MLLKRHCQPWMQCAVKVLAMQIDRGKQPQTKQLAVPI